MLAKPNEKRNDTANAKRTRLKKKLRRLTTTEALTLYSRIFKNCAESFEILRKNILVFC